MILKRTFLAAVMAIAVSIVTSALALAHGPDASGSGWHQGWHMGPGYGMGHGMMGRGMRPGYRMGPGMMGHGMRPGYRMGPGMMGHGMRPGYGMGHGMMGHGMGPGYRMGPGMMGQGQMGPGMMQPLRQDLSAKDVKHMMEHRLAWRGNPNIKVGKVEEKDDDTIIAEIITQDGSLVDRLEVDRHTGLMRRAE